MHKMSFMSRAKLFLLNKMASLTIQKFEGILVQSDLECESSIVCKHGVFLGDLLLTDRHGFKVFRRKQTVPLSVRGFQTIDKVFLPSDADSCISWFNKMLVEGYVQRIDQVFPVNHLYEDFSEIDYSAEIQALKTRLDQLDLVNMLDAEFVTALQSGGAAFSEIASQVATETSARQSADASQIGRLDVIETAGWVTAARCAGDVATQAELDAESSARQSADASQVGRLGVIETAGWVTAARCASDVATQAELDAESSARQSADASQVGRLGVIETAGWVTAARCASDVATQAELDAESSARQSADASQVGRLGVIETAGWVTAARCASDVATQAELDAAVLVEKNRALAAEGQEIIDRNAAIGVAVSGLLESAPATLSTLNDLAAALGDDESFSTTVTALIGTKADTSALTQEISDRQGAIALEVTDRDAAVLVEKTRALAAEEQRVLKATPVTTGTLQAQAGVQTLEIMGNNSLKLRSIGDADITIEPSGTGKLQVSKAVVCASTLSATAFTQSGQIVLDQSSSVQDLSDVTAVGSGSIITAAERTKVALVDVSSSVQGHLDLKYDSATAATQLGLASTDRTAIRSEFAAADGLVASASATARGVIQADVDANEADGDADRAAIRSEFTAADVVVASASATARGADSSRCRPK